jgi:hypothetical protein
VALSSLRAIIPTTGRQFTVLHSHPMLMKPHNLEAGLADITQLMMGQSMDNRLVEVLGHSKLWKMNIKARLDSLSL